MPRHLGKYRGLKFLLLPTLPREDLPTNRPTNTWKKAGHRTALLTSTSGTGLCASSQASGVRRTEERCMERQPVAKHLTKKLQVKCLPPELGFLACRPAPPNGRVRLLAEIPPVCSILVASGFLDLGNQPYRPVDHTTGSLANTTWRSKALVC